MRNSDSAGRVRRFMRAQRKTRGWSQTDLAGRANVARNTVAALERGMALREGNEGAIEEALGLPLGTIEDVRRTPPPAAETPERQVQQPEPSVSQTEFERLEDDTVARLLRRKWSPERIDRALDALKAAYLDLPTVEPTDDQPTATDRARNEIAVDRPSDTGTE